MKRNSLKTTESSNQGTFEVLESSKNIQTWTTHSSEIHIGLLVISIGCRCLTVLIIRREVRMIPQYIW